MTGGFAGSWPGVAGWLGTLWNGVPSGSVRSSGGVLIVPSGLTSGLAPAPDAGGWLGGVAAGPDWVPGRPWTWPLGGVPSWVWVSVGGFWVPVCWVWPPPPCVSLGGVPLPLCWVWPVAGWLPAGWLPAGGWLAGG